MLSASVEEKLSDLRVPEVEKMWSIASFSYYTRSYINEYYAINNEMLCGDAKRFLGVLVMKSFTSAIPKKSLSSALKMRCQKFKVSTRKRQEKTK